jgi:hypothetical protein
MDHYTLILMSDERSPVRRIQVPKAILKRSLSGGIVVALLLGLATWDYVRVRRQNARLVPLQLETTEQSKTISQFETTLSGLQGEIDRVRLFERKVRIIANLPGSAATGGAEITELAPEGEAGDGEDPKPPAGVPMDFGKGGGDVEGIPTGETIGVDLDPGPWQTEDAQHVHKMDGHAKWMEVHARERGESLAELIGQLEDKRSRLEGLPSLWPTKGWLTSRFGSRISPFTGKRQRHTGVDIAAKPGTPIISPARARVHFVGRKGPLGKSVVLDHGFGVRTLYGHTQEIFVKAGDVVERGELVASVGSTGRSTGPHLHYTVEVNGRARDPLDYIFD